MQRYKVGLLGKRMRLWEIPDQIQGFLDSDFYSVTGMLIFKRGGSRIRGPRYDGRISKGRKCVGCIGRWTRDEADALKLGGDT